MALKEKKSVETWLNTRKCTACKEIKEENSTNFYSRGKSAMLKNGTIPFSPVCKECTKNRVKEQRKTKIEADPALYKKHIKNTRAKHKDKATARSKEWAKNNPDKRFNAYLKRNYSITLEDYYKMEEDQEGKCKICGTADTSKGKGKRLFVDHCHITGNVRGLLCHNCNAGIGHFFDNIISMEKAIQYIKESAWL